MSLSIKNKLIYIILLIIFLISFSNIFNPKLDLNGDNFDYLLLAKAITQGKGYVSLLSEQFTPASHFPPGYPYLIAFFMFILGNNILTFKILNGLFLFFSVGLIFKIGKTITNNVILFFSISTLILLNSHLLKFATMIMSEMSFLFFSTLAIYMIFSFPENKKFYKSLQLYILIISISASYYIRSVGIVLLISTLLYFLIQKKWKISLSILAGFVVLYIPWAIRNSIYGIKSRYLGTVITVNPWRPEEGSIKTFSDFFNKMITNFDETVIKGFVDVLFPFTNIKYNTPSNWLLICSSIIILCLIIYGAWKMGKLKYFFILYILGNIGIFMIWHGGNGARYVVPLIPFIYLLFFNGLFFAIRLVIKQPSIRKNAGFAFLLLSFMMIKPLDNLKKQSTSPYPAAYKNFFDVAKLVKKNTPENIIVSSRKPQMFYYYSQRYSTGYAFSVDNKLVIKQLYDSNVDYVILDQLGYSSTPRYLYPAIKNHPEVFKTIIHLKNPDTYLLQFQKEKARSLINSN